MNFIQKTFGGLSKQYYIRQFLFGCIFAAGLIAIAIHSNNLSPDTGKLLGGISMAVVFTFLYPYSRFVYESIVGYIMGDNVFFLNAGLMMCCKAMTMVFCWALSVFIAPIGMIYLYFYHSKRLRELSE